MSILLGFFQKKILKDKLLRIIKGVVKEIPIVGQVQDNINSEDGGKDNFDWYKFIGSIALPALLLIALFAGWIDLETLKQLADIFK